MINYEVIKKQATDANPTLQVAVCNFCDARGEYHLGLFRILALKQSGETPFVGAALQSHHLKL